ncbi:hypothetical protein ACFQS1_19700 [Paractinoplanes rhizophilus]|uniref:Uncharacterized protein n=1 Tax=Paractinoplanes rhizophilus TaxID=1416877 RepID=A0ABW2HVN6_9ACTN
MGVAPITSNLVQTGPGRIRYAPLATAIPTFTPTASKFAPTWTNWLDVGSTDAGVTYTESTETADIRVAESKYPVRVVTTSKSSRVAFVANEISDLIWKLAMNGGTTTVTGTAGTKMTEYAPPLADAEVRVMLAFQSNLDDEIIVWPQVFNVGSVEYVRGTFETKAGLSMEWNAEIPSSGYTTPYKRFTTGALSLAT